MIDIQCEDTMIEDVKKEYLEYANAYFDEIDDDFNYELAFYFYMEYIDNDIESFYEVFYILESRLDYIQFLKEGTLTHPDDIPDSDEVLKEMNTYKMIAQRLGWMFSTGNGTEKNTEVGSWLLNMAK